MTSLFDAVEAQRRRDEGMARAATSRAGALSFAQEIAFGLGIEGTFVDSDLVAERMEQLGVNYDILGNAAGSVFRSKINGRRWIWTGRVRSSNRISTHSRIIRIWRLSEVGE